MQGLKQEAIHEDPVTPSSWTGSGFQLSPLLPSSVLASSVIPKGWVNGLWCLFSATHQAEVTWVTSAPSQAQNEAQANEEHLLYNSNMQMLFRSEPPDLPPHQREKRKIQIKLKTNYTETGGWSPPWKAVGQAELPYEKLRSFLGWTQ